MVEIKIDTSQIHSICRALSRPISTTIVLSVAKHVTDFLVWDGDCAFCARCVAFIERRIKTDAKMVA
ncbi:MAG: hypothetical protein EBQ64_05770, partial [Acidimicrobiia bacterium]|nr:hypothetical protein [Acidimicrobiia bacterium]